MSGTRISSLSGKITVLSVICLFGLQAHAKYGGGSGTPEDPYQIRDPNHMQAIGADSNDWDKCFMLMADIDVSDFTGGQLNIIGSPSQPFTGVFDGAGFAISNFTYDSNDTAYVGLFGYVFGAMAQIGNLGLVNPRIYAVQDTGGISFVGSLIGYLSGGTVEACYADRGSVVGNGDPAGTNFHAGGLVGYNEGGTIENSYANIEVIVTVKGFSSNSARCGGLVGFNRDGRITQSFATGPVQGTALGQYAAVYVGGLVANNVYLAEIANCYATSRVIGTGGESADIGGLVGRNAASTIANSYATGRVNGTADFMVIMGGLVGSLSQNSITNSFWDTQTSGQTNGVGSGPASGVTGKTTNEMAQQATFDPPWDFVDTWGIIEDETYPLLRSIKFCAQTSYPVGDYNRDCRVNFLDFAKWASSWLENKNW